MSSFNLAIKLGNAAMESGEDIAGALEVVARKIRLGAAAVADGGDIRDEYGNTVGTWSIN